MGFGAPLHLRLVHVSEASEASAGLKLPQVESCLELLWVCVDRGAHVCVCAGCVCGSPTHVHTGRTDRRARAELAEERQRQRRLLSSLSHVPRGVPRLVRQRAQRRRQLRVRRVNVARRQRVQHLRRAPHLRVCRPPLQNLVSDDSAAAAHSAAGAVRCGTSRWYWIELDGGGLSALF